MRYLLNNPGDVWQLTLQHLQIVGVSMAIAILIGVPVGITVHRLRWLEGPVTSVAGVLYTVPSLALFAVLIPYTGLGVTAAVIALTMYSLLVIIRNTVAGIDSVDPATIMASRGMGMTGAQRLFMVELPLGLPIILAGIRVATVSNIGIATIAAAIGAGGLGTLIFNGISTFNTDQIVAGAISASVLSLLADLAIGRLGDLARRDMRRA
ncbi:MAG: ABC transporter permease [Chloroflexota bacterium]